MAAQIEKPQSITWSRTATDVGWWLLSLGGLITLWELAYFAGWISPSLLPPPHLFLPLILDTSAFQAYGIGTASSDVNDWALLIAIAATFRRVFLGLVIGFVVGTVLGFLVHYLRWFGYIATPMLRLAAAISPVAWLPIAIAVFKSGERTAVFVVAVSIAFLLALSVSEIVAGIPKNYVNAARIMGATRRQLFLDVILPHSLPMLYTLLRFNFYGAWMAVLLAELFDVKVGLGIIIFLSRSYLNVNLAYLGIVLIGVCGLSVDILLRQAERRLFWWQNATAGGES